MAGPDPAAPPCLGAEHLHYHWGSAWGDRFLLGTEGIAVALFNGAYPLREVVFELRGEDAQGRAERRDEQGRQRDRARRKAAQREENQQ